MLLNKKLGIFNHWRHRSYSASRAAALHDGCNFHCMGDSGVEEDDDDDDDDGALLLNVRFVSSTEYLCAESCRNLMLVSSSDEGFGGSSSHESSSNNFWKHHKSKDVRTGCNKIAQRTFPTTHQPNSCSFGALFLKNDNYLSAIRAAVTGNALQLLHLINVLKVPVDATNSHGITLLHLSIKNDHVAATRMLLSLGANSRHTTIKGRSVLHTATHNNATGCLKLLLKFFCEQENSNVKENECTKPYEILLQPDLNGDTLLHLACRLRKKRCLKIILSHILKYLGWPSVEEMLQRRNKCNQTPIHVACFWKSVETVNLLLTDNFDKVVVKIYNSKEGSYIATALRDASRRTLFWTIEKGTILHELAAVKCSCEYCSNKESSSSFEYNEKMETTELKMYLFGECNAVETSRKRCGKCDKAQLEVVRIVLSCCPELLILRDVLGQTTIMCSVINDAVPLTRAVLQHGSFLEQVDPSFHTALHHAAVRGQLSQVALLLEYGASVRRQDDCGATPMHYAAARGLSGTLKLLYKVNKCVDEVRTNNGHNAFMWAAINGMDNSIRAMIDVNPMISREECDKQGCTALHLAAAGDHVEVINTLLFLKWNAEKRNKLGETPLIVAAKNGRTNAVRQLLNAGVDYYTYDKFNNTALHLTANSDEKIETLRELLRYSHHTPLLNAQNHTGQTPLHFAAEHNAVKCMRYLFKCGADPLIKDSRGWDPLMVAIEQNCWSTITLILKNSPNINCYAAGDSQTTLSLALEKKNYILASFLQTNGAMLPSEIQNTAARTIQRWYRAHFLSRCHSHTIAIHELKEISFSP